MLAKLANSRGTHFIGYGTSRTPNSTNEFAGFLHSPFRQSLARGLAMIALSTVALAFANTCLAQNSIQIEVVEPDSGTPVPARIEFTKSGKKLTKDRKVLSVGDHWLAEGTLSLKPPPGDYEFNVRRGPEFKDVVGGFSVQRGGNDTVLVEVPRAIDMHAEYWFSGDHGAFLPRDQLAKWQMAEALDMAVTWLPPPKEQPKPPAKRNKQADEPELPDPNIVGHRLMTLSQSYASPALGVVVHGLASAVSAANSEKKEPSQAKSQELETITAWETIVREQANTDVLAEITQPWSRDVPLLLAYPSIRAVQLLNSANRPYADDRFVVQANNSGDEFGRILLSLGKERLAIPVLAPFKQEDRIRYKDPRGVGVLAESLFRQMLEAGLRLTPTAGSGFGRADSYLGYNRVYVHCDQSLTNESYWNAIRSSATVVTNGPLLRAMLNGLPPGAVIPSYRRQPIPLDFDVNLAVREKVDYLDVVFNGETLYSAKLEEHYQRGQFPPLEIKESGWLVLRVVTEHADGYRLATTAPYYFEFEGERRISKKAIEFFQEWLRRSEEAIRKEGDLPEVYRTALRRAHDFWDDLQSKANAD